LAVLSSASAQQIVNIDGVSAQYGDPNFTPPATVFNGQGVLGTNIDIYWNGYTNVGTTITNLLDSQGNLTTVSFHASQGGNDILYCASSTTASLPADGGSPNYNLWVDGIEVRFGDTVNFTIAGLDTNSVYEIVTYSCLGSGVGATYTGQINGSVIGNNRSGFVLNGNYLDSKPIAPNSTGTITFSITDPPSPAVSALNGLQIQRMVPTSYIPVVTTLSSNMTFLPGSSFTLSASVDSGSLQAYYQWYLGGNPVANATNINLTIPSLSAAQAGSYSLVASNSAGASAPCAIATVTLDTTTTVSIFSGGDFGEGLDLSGTFSLAEDYGGYAQAMTIQNANFDVNESRTGGSINGGAPGNQPNMGSTLNDTNAAMICNSFDQASGSALSFTVPNTAGQNYKLQLIFHDGYFSLGAQRPMSVIINSEAIDPYLDLGAMNAATTQPQGVVISYFFTGTGTDLPVTINGLKTGFPAILNAMTLEALPASPAALYFVETFTNQTVMLGNSVALSAPVGGSAPPFYYRWYQGTNLLAGQNSSTLNINATSTNVAGLYTLTVSNSVGVISNSATVTVIANVYNSLVFGPNPGQGLNFQGNFVQAQYFGTGGYDPQLSIGGALFTLTSVTNAGGSGVGSSSQTPLFGINGTETVNGTNYSKDQINLGLISSFFASGITNFNIPTTLGATYRLQLILHDGNSTVGQRNFSVIATNATLGSNVLVSGLDLVSKGAYRQYATNVAIVYYYTGDGNPLNLSFPATISVGILDALTVEQLTPVTAPTVALTLGTNSAFLGDTLQWESCISGEQMSYQWQVQSNGLYYNIPWGTNNILGLTNLTSTSFTNYQLIASNPAGALTNSGTLLQLQYQPHTLIGQWASGAQTLVDQSGYFSGSSHDGIMITNANGVRNGSIPGGSGNLPVWSSDVPAGFTGSSLDFSTVPQTAVEIANTAVSDMKYNGLFDRSISNGFTVTFWAKGWPAAANGCFIGKRGENASPFKGWQVRKSSSTGFASTAQYNIGEKVSWLSDTNDASDWHHYALSWSGTVRNLYVDNTLVVSVGDAASIDMGMNSHLILGGEQNTTVTPNNTTAFQNWSLVKLYDVRIYGYGLAAADIQSINQLPTRNPFVTVTGPAQGQGLDLQENFVLSEYYGGGTSTNRYVIGGAVFNPVTNRVFGTASTANKPNFGTNTDQKNLATLSSQMISMTNSLYLPGITNAFAISNLVSGHQYSLQLLFHDNLNEVGQHKEFTVQIGTTNYSTYYLNGTPQGSLQQMLDPAARGAAYTNATDVVLTNTFISDGTPLIICMAPLAGTYPTAVLNAMTLADLSLPVTAPVWLVLTTNVQSNTGATVQMMGNAAGAQVTYQWQELVNGVFTNLMDVGKISGSQQNAIVITGANSYNSGTYRLAASNSGGTIYSTNSLLIIVPQPSAVSLSVNNGQLTLGWTNGVLEETPALQGSNTVWTILTNTTPVVIPLNGTTGNMFYRAINQ
jgi:hypothetical protein